MGDPLAHGATIFAAAISPDGTTAVTAGQDDAARLWDIQRAEALGSPMLQRAHLLRCVWSLDGQNRITNMLGLCEVKT